MAETTVENRICQNCGAEVRPNSLFCYSCGKSVAPEIVADFPPRKNGDGADEIKSTMVAEPVEKPIPKPVIESEEPKIESLVEGEKSESKAIVKGEEPKLKSAAAMRRRSKSFQPKRVEIIWEEHENAPNVWFILAAILLTAFAAAVFYLAIFSK